MNSKAAAIAALAGSFQRNGYVRPSAARRALGVGAGRFRRGFEVRLTANSRAELLQLETWLRQFELVPGKPFRKANKWRLPLYGRNGVERFLALIGEPGLAEVQRR